LKKNPHLGEGGGMASSFCSEMVFFSRLYLKIAIPPTAIKAIVDSRT
jgi:hypothetical protein